MMERAVKVIEEIAAERERQVAEEGWSADHDDHHTDRSLAAAAASYAWLASLHELSRKEQIRRRSFRESGVHATIHDLWPRSWADKWFKPKTRRRDLIRAAALIVAEIERIDRGYGRDSHD